jgi:peptidoglycan hydrolase-like protein with peptidoglycan-binding domain
MSQLGCDVLGFVPSFAPTLAPTPTSPPVEYGPATGSIHTDKATIEAVQRRLNMFGYGLPVNGVFDAATEAALFKFSGEHGPPSDATIAKLSAPSNLAAMKQVQDAAIQAAAEAALGRGRPAQAAATSSQETTAQPRFGVAPARGDNEKVEDMVRRALREVGVTEDGIKQPVPVNKSGGMPVWGVGLIIAGSVAVVGGLIYALAKPSKVAA